MLISIYLQMRRYWGQWPSYKSLFAVTLMIFIFASIIQTYPLLKSQFTIYDDIGVAETLLYRNMDYVNNCDKNRNTFIGKISSLLIVDKQKACEFTLKFNRIHYISELWTYAPLQFWFTQYLLDKPNILNYEETKFWGRMPSFFAHILGLLTFFWVLKNKIPLFMWNPSLPYVLTAIMAFSIEQRIFSALMPSYAIGLLSFSLALWGLIELSKLSVARYRSVLFYGMLLSISVSMQYQSLLLVFAGLLAVAVNSCIRDAKKFLCLIGTFLIGTAILTPNILSFRDRGVMWNAGPNLEFVVTGNSIPERCLDLIRLLFTQTQGNFYAILSAIELSPLGIKLFGFIFLIFTVAGAYSLWANRKDRITWFLFVLFGLFFFGYALLLMMGKLAWSPTRHSLYLAPIFLILTGYGYIFFANKFRNSYFAPACIVTLLLYLTSSLVLFKEFATTHEDSVNEIIFSSMTKDSGANFMLFDSYFVEPKYMKSLADFPNFWFRPLEDYKCNNYQLVAPSHNVMKFIWFSREDKFNPLTPDFASLMQDFLSRCGGQILSQGSIISINKVKDLVLVPNNFGMEFNRIPLVDLSYNNTYLQLYEMLIETPSIKSASTGDSGLIDFKARYPDFVRYTSGIAQSESWGRWTDSSDFAESKIGFNDPLPKKFTLEFRAVAYDQNDSEPTTFKVGNTTKQVVVSKDPQKIYRLNFDNLNSDNVIQIIPSKPVSPNSLNSNNSDRRKLGIGLITMKILTE